MKLNIFIPKNVWLLIIELMIYFQVEFVDNHSHFQIKKTTLFILKKREKHSSNKYQKYNLQLLLY
jgi:hypothetical protein